MTCPHCNTPISEHPAGQCLDALVAERVMGWRRLDKPNYSTDPAAMMELMGKLAEKYTCIVGMGKHEDPQVFASIASMDSLHVSEASTLPLALARAAVMATEGGGE